MNKHASKFLKACCLLSILLAGTVLNSQDWSIKKAPLMTKWAGDLDINNPLPEYPRPQMVRRIKLFTQS